MFLDANDRLDLLDLYARYALLFDDGQPDAWARLFTPDGTFTITGGPVATGTDDLAEFGAKMHARVPGVRHLTSNVCVEGTPLGARGNAYVLVVGRADDGSLKVVTMGTYTDDFIKNGVGWRFRSRTYTPWAGMDSAGATLVFPAGVTVV